MHLPAPCDQPVDLSIVIPAKDEEGRLPQTLAALEEFGAGQSRSYELILVDDGSRDRTRAVMLEAARRHLHVKVVTLERNRGKGYAVAQGVAQSGGRLVLITDADLSTPIGELDKLEASLEAGADVAIASRAKRGKTIVVSQPAYRVLMGKAFNLLVQSLLLPGLWDTQCGFKLFKGDQARAIFARMRTEGFAFDVEALYLARRSGLRVAEVPVRWAHSAPTRVAPLRHSADMFKDVLKIRLRR